MDLPLDKALVGLIRDLNDPSKPAYVEFGRFWVLPSYRDYLVSLGFVEETFGLVPEQLRATLEVFFESMSETSLDFTPISLRNRDP